MLIEITFESIETLKSSSRHQSTDYIFI